LTFFSNTLTDKDHFIYEQINWVQHVEGFDWYIVASVNTAELNQSSDLLRTKLLMLSAIVVGVSIVLVSVMMGRLLLPIRKLSQVASLVTDGDLTARCNINGHDEISFLANNFNTMVGRLKSNIDELDQKVLKRTKALDTANQELLSTVGQLEQHNFEVTELNRLAEELQSCNDLKETFSVVAERLAALFPLASGCLYVAQTLEVGDKFAPVIQWGTQPISEAVLDVDDCLAFTDYRIKLTVGLGQESCCRHIDQTGKHLSLCLPLLGKQDIIGLVYLVFGQKDQTVADFDERLVDKWKRLATSVTDQLTMIMANIKLRDRLQNLSVRDGLTGLFNRRYMEETLKREFMFAARAKHPVGLIILDVDFFKKFNDTYGHDAGDIVLVELARLLASNVRNCDVVCRFGGEEFVIILPGPPPEAALARAELLRAKVENELQINYQGQALKLTISLGAAIYPTHGETPDQILKAADTALYKAKESGRNRAMLASG
jgi:diguanylate cyclase (GGDEF)-like protein